MTIRYKCDQCGSTLNIKEELAGTPGKCPKCKTAFVVPAPDAASPIQSPQTKPAPPATRPAPKAKQASTKSRRKAQDDFDPMAVLMGDEPPKGRRAAAPPPLSDDEIPADLALDLEMEADEVADVPRSKSAKKRKRVQFDSDDDFDAALPNSAAASANAMLSGGASAGAKDLLTRTMEESRARAARIDDDEPRNRGPRLMDYVREFGPQGAAILGGLTIAVVGLYYLAGSMYGGGMPLPELGRVYGTITLDGQPLEGAKVRFTPADRTETIEGKERQRLRASTAITDAQGYYDLYYTEDVRGAATTEQRVVIMKMGPDGRLITPAALSDFSTETRIVESGSNEFNFALQSDPKPDAAPPRR